MLLVIVLAMVRSRNVSFRIQLPALLAHAGVLVFAAGIVFSSGSRQEISLNLSPGSRLNWRVTFSVLSVSTGSQR